MFWDTPPPNQVSLPEPTYDTQCGNAGIAEESQPDDYTIRYAARMIFLTRLTKNPT